MTFLPKYTCLELIIPDLAIKEKDQCTDFHGARNKTYKAYRIYRSYLSYRPGAGAKRKELNPLVPVSSV